MITKKQLEVQRGRRLRSLIFYSTMGALMVLSLSYFVWSLRDLILPGVLGILMAYLFRPLIRSPAFAFLPYRVRAISSLTVLSLVLFGLIFLVQRSWPDDRGQLELRVRLLYKVNERYAKIMGIKDRTSEGNLLYSMFGREMDPLKLSLEHMMSLSKEEGAQFLQYSQTPGLSAELTQRYLKYYNANLASNTHHLRHPSSAEAEATVESRHDNSSTLAMALHLASTWLLLPVIFLFLLFDDRHIVRYFVSLVPNRYFELTLTMINEVDQAIGNYLRGTFLECTLVAIATTIGLIVIGFPLKAALMVGIFAGIVNAIPFLGPMIALMVGLTYALIAEDLAPFIPGLSADSIFFGVIAVIGIVHMIDNVVFAPVVLGGAVNLHPLVVILGVMGGSIAFGFGGMLLAIPAIVVIKVMSSTLFRGLKAYQII